MEEGKRDLITREIGKFREIMKVNSFLQLHFSSQKTSFQSIVYKIVNTGN